MGAARSHLVEAPLGQVSLDGQGVIHVTSVNVNQAVQELEAISGCDPVAWHTAAQKIDWTGDFQCQDFALQMLLAATGGSIIASTASQAIAKEEPQTIEAGAVPLDNTNIFTDADGYLVGVVELHDATGSTVMKQIAPAGTPAAGEFKVTDAAAGTLAFNTGDNDGTIKVTYAYRDATRNNLQVNRDDVPPYVELLVPLCAASLAAPTVSDPVGIYFPRARIVGSAHSAQTGQNQLATMTYNFRAVADGNGLVLQVI